MDSAWPMFGHDVKHTGRSPYSVDGNNPYFLWKYFYWDASFHSSPVIDNDGIIYIGSAFYFFAINPNGTLKWKFRTDELIRDSAAIADDGTIYIGDIEGKLYAINPDGSKKWIFREMPEFYCIFSSPAIDKDGNIYIGTTTTYKMYSIFPNGTMRWNYTADYDIYSSPSPQSI